MSVHYFRRLIECNSSVKDQLRGLFRKMSCRDLPVVVVLGCTGTGKSKLALDIAGRFSGEVISADSMQVYKGLDIVTNKVKIDEMGGIAHHVMDYIDPLDNYTVVDFQTKALPIINRLLEEEKLPVVVGGTNYYIESLLWKVLVTKQNGSGELTKKDVPQCNDAGLTDANGTSENRPGNGADSMRLAMSSSDSSSDCEDDCGNLGHHLDSTHPSDLYKCLQEVDPEMAEQLHPNDRRKILRSLEVYEKHGCTHTEILKEQKSAEGGSSLGGPLRFPNSCIFWLQCRQTVLDKRLDDRVDDMIEQGLIQELQDFHHHYNKQRLSDNRSADYTRGIFQCIGFKEFHSYLLLTDAERQTPEAQKLLREGVDMLKLATRRYARKQIKWIVNRFLRCPDRQVPPVYALDATDPADWDTEVLLPAREILACLLKNETPAAVPLPVEQRGVTNKRKQAYCEVCQKILLGEEQWAAHLNSRKHKILTQKQRKQKSQEVEITS